MMMPDMDGFDAQDGLRSLESPLRMIGSSGLRRPAVQEESWADVNEFLPKPYSDEQVFRLLRQVVDQITEPKNRMMQLLVIDDEPLILETVSLAFPDDRVTTCLNAEDGIAAFLKATPDVVLCDIRLPDLSGMEAFEKLHRIDPKVPIILMTGAAPQALRSKRCSEVRSNMSSNRSIPKR